MEHGFKIHWVMVGFGAVVVGKILTAALAKWANFSM